VDGTECHSQLWSFVTWKQELSDPTGWVIAKQPTARLDGSGVMLVEVGDDLEPMLSDRVGIVCAESLIC